MTRDDMLDRLRALEARVSTGGALLGDTVVYIPPLDFSRVHVDRIYAAIVASVSEDGYVSLTLCDPERTHVHRVPYSESPMHGSWSLPLGRREPRPERMTAMLLRHDASQDALRARLADPSDAFVRGGA